MAENLLSCACEDVMRQNQFQVTQSKRIDSEPEQFLAVPAQRAEPEAHRNQIQWKRCEYQVSQVP